MWTPENKVLDVVNVVDNLLAYIGDNQTDALEWANGGTPMDDFASLYPNAPGRLISKFPALICLSQAYETDLTGDLLIAGLELKFEGAVTGPNLDDLTLNTKRYAMAVESMLANVPSATLSAGATNTIQATLFEIGTAFDLTGQLKTANSFLAIFQTKAIYKITGAAF